MDTFVVILREQMLAVVTGIVTFLITKYSCNRNRPLNKMEIAYNRFYYPLLRLIRDENIVDEQFIEKCEYYLIRYKKYVDGATVRAFKDYKSDMKNEKVRKKFINNIYENNTILRRNLGYLESGVYTHYKYSSTKDKRMIKFVCSVMLLNVFPFINQVIKMENVRNVLTILFAFSFIFAVYQILAIVIDLAWKHLKKLI